MCSHTHIYNKEVPIFLSLSSTKGEKNESDSIAKV